MELNYAIPIGTQLRDPGDPLLSSLEYVRRYVRTHARTYVRTSMDHLKTNVCMSWDERRPALLHTVVDDDDDDDEYDELRRVTTTSREGRRQRGCRC